jgi:phenylacetate-CoA ligase
MFVHPSQVAEIVQRHPQVRRARLVVSGEMAEDHLVLSVEVQDEPHGLAQRLTEALREVTKLRGEVRLCPVGSLPNDGKVIEDARSYR